jgi:hypothetical protein
MPESVMVEPSTPHGDTPQSEFVLRYDRILAATGCRTHSDLARMLGIKQAAVSDVKRRKSIPAEWLLNLFEKMGINPEWIRSGSGGCFLRIANQACGKTPTAATPTSQLDGCTTEELLAEIARRMLKAI